MFGKQKSQLKEKTQENNEDQAPSEDHLRKLAILQVEPINFTIRNEQGKQAINSSFQKFLNSLDFPIQIIIGTNYLNLDSYVNALELRVRMRRHLLIFSLLMCGLVLISACGSNVKKEDVLKCSHQCEIGIKKCTSDVNFSDWMEGNRDYFEWNCDKDGEGCGKWATNHQKCNLGDLSAFDVGIEPIKVISNGESWTVEVGDVVTLHALVESRGPEVPESIDLSFFVNITPCDEFPTCLGSQYQNVTVTNEFIGKKTQKIVDASPTYKQTYSSEGLHYSENAITRINISYELKTPGNYVFYIIVDDDEKMMEADESNNIYEQTLGGGFFVHPKKK